VSRAVLVLAGSDPLGYSGLQADLRHLAHARVLGLGIPTALTLQAVDRMESATPVAAAHVQRALELALADSAVGAVKIGLVLDPAVMRCIAHVLRQTQLPVVLDPVLVATAGAPFHDAESRGAMLEHLLPCASLVTPNLPELATLSGASLSTDVEVLAAAHALRRDSELAVLVKGGHAQGPSVEDVLIHAGRVQRFTSPRRAGTMPRGTGCMFSTLVAAALAEGEPMAAAVERAHAQVQLALAAAIQAGRRRLSPSSLDQGRG
jgi:hydroxymethylpyrimidine/phosphomethylpyrimidine kinase